MARSSSLRAQAERLKKAGRYGDTELAHLSPDEIEILNLMQGGESINPVTGLPEYFSLKKVLKGAAKAAGAMVGAYFGGPAGAAAGGALTSKLLGDSWTNSLSTGLLSGLGAYGAQQFGVGDALGVSSLSSGADLLGRTAQAAAPAAAGAVQTASAAGGAGKGISSMLPLLGVGAAMAGGASQPKYKAPKNNSEPDDSEIPEYESLDRDQLAYAGDPYSYGQQGGEFQFFDQVNPDLQPLAMRRGGRVHFRFGGESAGDTSEGKGDPTGADRGGGGRNGGGTGNGGGGRRSDQPPHAGTGGGQTAGLGNRGGLGGLGGGRNGGGISDAERRARAQYSESMRAAGMANLAGPPGYGSAVDSYNNRSPAWDVVDFLAGPFINAKKPDPTIPGSFTGGNWHTSTSIPGVVGAIGGMAAGVPIIGGVAGSWIGDQLGIQDVYHGALQGAGGHPAQQPGGANGEPGKGISQYTNKLPRPIAVAPHANTNTPRPGLDNKGAGDDEVTGDDRSTGRTFTDFPGDPYSYGQVGPEWQFFTGEIQPQEIDMARGGGVSGPGTGQSDDIPAMLSNGEHVIDAETVSMIGDGSNDAGHAKLEKFKRGIRAHKRRAKPHRIPPKAKGISQYMRAA